MNKNNSKSSLINLLLIILILAISFGYALPTFQKASVLNADIAQLKNEKTAASQSLQDIQAKQLEQSTQTEVSKNVELTAIPQKLAQDSLLREINKMAQDSQVNLNSISFSIPVDSKEEVKRATVSLTTSATPKNLVKFLQSIENSSRKILVKNITVQIGQFEETESANFSISLETFYLDSI